MRVIIVNQFFYPDISATGQLITDLAEDLASQGIQVTVVSSRRAYLGGDTKLPQQENYRGIDIQRIGGTGFGKGSVFGRLMDYLVFYLLCGLRLLRIPRHDVILVFTTPPLIAFLCWIVCRIRGIRLVYSVQDLYPQVAIQMGVLKRGGWLARLCENLSQKALTGSDHVVVLGECMKQRVLQEGVPKDKITLIPNWSDDPNLAPLSEEKNWFWQKHDLAGKFVVQYSGNMGLCHEFATVLAAAREFASEEKEINPTLRSVRKILFLFIGNGTRRQEIREFCEDENLQNVKILDYQPRDTLLYSLNACSVSLVTLQDGLEGIIMPSKFYGILATGKPVLYVGPQGSDVARVIAGSACGFTIAPGDVKGLIKAVGRLRDDPALCIQMGNRGREVLLDRFTRQKSTSKYYQLLVAINDQSLVNC
jgi:glycosyltransferase involved in cell wall biosynthesis